MASMTVVGVFDNASEAQQAVEALVSDGFSRSNIDLSAAQSGSQSYNTDDYNSGTNNSDTKDVGSSFREFFDSLFGSGDDADKYNRVVSDRSIVTVHTQSDDEAERAADILDDNGAIDVDERAATYGGTTGSGLTESGTSMGTGLVDNTVNTTDYDRTNNTDRSDLVDGDQKIQLVEENLQVGKREVETGGVRVRSRIVERPVEENLRLREERVVIQRTPVNRPATDADLTAFQEGQIELRETAEQAVISKTANVVEEITIGKEVNEREETIRDTVRKTEVDVENLATNDQTVRSDRTGFNTDGTTYSNQ